MPKPLFVTLLIAIPVALAVVTSNAIVGLVALTVILIANPLIWKFRKHLYFDSDEFHALRAEAASVVFEHNEVVNYVAAIRSQGSFALGYSATGQHAHLASYDNNSAWNYKRDRNIADYAPNVHNASLQIVNKAKQEPIKYLMKYFSIKADPATLAEVQRVAQDVARLENAVENVVDRETDIVSKMAPPAFVLRRYAQVFWDLIGVELSPIRVPYPTYTFQYVSAGGNSGQSASITLDTEVFDVLSATLVEKIRWTKSAAGQRSLMTARLRNQIKHRDNYACKMCGVALRDQPHLLLEIDHIIPVSRGGLSTPENLQTLCWRCNRSKGAKMPV